MLSDTYTLMVMHTSPKTHTNMHTLFHQGVSFTRWTCIPSNTTSCFFSLHSLLTSVSSRGFDFWVSRRVVDFSVSICLSTCLGFCMSFALLLAAWRSLSILLSTIYLPINVVNFGTLVVHSVQIAIAVIFLSFSELQITPSIY